MFASAMMPGMKIWDVYEQYKIMPNLRLHQLRVASVARALAQERGADHELVTRAGLVHDMGNILKADFSVFPPDFFGDVGLAYWSDVKSDYAARYGSDEHTATIAIVHELGLSDAVATIVASMGFSKAGDVYEHGSLELQIIEYADQRVAPYGITSMETRLQEGRERYKKRAGSDYGTDDGQFENNLEILKRLEKQLFEGLTITPASITEESQKDTVELLRSYEIA